MKNHEIAKGLFNQKSFNSFSKKKKKIHFVRDFNVKWWFSVWTLCWWRKCWENLWSDKNTVCILHFFFLFDTQGNIYHSIRIKCICSFFVILHSYSFAKKSRAKYLLKHVHRSMVLSLVKLNGNHIPALLFKKNWT